ncbi:MAG: ParA family protein [Candidatus Binatia bacterium]
MRKIAVFLSKGGVGKTTTAVHLAAGLANKGARVLLIDTDTQGQVSVLLGARPAAGLAEVVTVGLKPEIALLQARERLWLLSGGQGLANVKRLIARKDPRGEDTLAEALAPLEGRYDYVILDTSPGWDTLNNNVLFYAQEILTPVSLEALTLQSLQDFQENLAAIQHYRSVLTLKYILPTFLDGRVRKSKDIWEQLRDQYTDRLCDPIRYNVRLSEAAGQGKTIFEYAPHSPGAEDYQRLIDKIVLDTQGKELCRNEPPLSL